MSGSIQLHRKKGVNPKICYCPVCGEDSGLILFGAADYVDECPSCGTLVYGGVKVLERCPKCHHGPRRVSEDWNRRAMDEGSRVPVPQLCSRCEDKMKTKIACILAKEVNGKPERLGPVVFVDEAQFRDVFNGEAAQAALKRRVCYFPREVWDKVGLPAPAECEKIVAEQAKP